MKQRPVQTNGMRVAIVTGKIMKFGKIWQNTFHIVSPEKFKRQG